MHVIRIEPIRITMAATRPTKVKVLESLFKLF